MEPHAHLTPDEIEAWAHGLLAAGRAMHLAECGDCLSTAERERKLFVQLAQLERFAPSAEFAEHVMTHVRIPAPSGDFKA